MKMLRVGAVLACLWFGGSGTGAYAQEPPKEKAEVSQTILEKLQAEADAVRPTAQTPLARAFLDSTRQLTLPKPRTLYADPKTREYLSEASANKRDDEARKALKPVPVSPTLYYTTKYGSPIAYTRLLEILGKHGTNTVQNKRLLDFGYGGIGHLRMWAGMGANAVGVDVDPFLRELYSLPEDTGKVSGANGANGTITLHDGQFPKDAAITNAIGSGYDLIVSKNTLKLGYIHPQREVSDKRMLIDLGVSDEAFLHALHTALKPGGRVLLYNLCPAQAPPDKPYIPWADGQSPFTKAQWEAAGFKVLALDVVDNEAARAQGRALGWDKGARPMNLETDLFAWYTLVEKAAK
jgi:hypothetical protein